MHISHNAYSLCVQKGSDHLEDVGVSHAFVRVIETRGVNELDTAAIWLKSGRTVNRACLGLLSMSDADVVVASEEFDKLVVKFQYPSQTTRYDE